MATYDADVTTPLWRREVGKEIAPPLGSSQLPPRRVHDLYKRRGFDSPLSPVPPCSMLNTHKEDAFRSRRFSNIREVDP